MTDPCQIDYEEEYQRQRIAWLESISQQAERAKSALHFAWINATCHREIFDYFDVDPTMTPTVVFYTAGKNKHTTMIGKFDHKTVVEQSDLFVTGKLPVFKPKIDLRDIIIKDIDCSQPAAAVQEDDGFDEILAEILAEEEATKKKKEDDGDYKSKHKKKKPAKKGKGKKEDL